jgi:hypothetical protein
LGEGLAEPTLMWRSEVGYGGGWLVEDGYLYAIGYAIGCHGGFLVENCRVGRVPLFEALVKSSWRYYAGGSTWSADENAAVTVFQGGAAGNPIFCDKALTEYVAIYSGVYNNNVFYRVANHPWGPWSDQALLFTAVPGEQGTVDYAALAHPEFEENDGLSEYVTYVQTTGFLQQSIQLVKVTFQSATQ